MDINPNIPRQVNAGEPVTAEGWNVIVKAIVALTTYLTQESTLSVKLAPPDLDVSKARVTATRADNQSKFQAVAPSAAGGTFVFSGLKPGSYEIRATAVGFAEAVSTVTAPVTDPVTLTLAANAVLMPQLFGETLSSALVKLQAVKIDVSRIIDVSGKDIPPANPDPELAKLPVLLQLPDAGTPMAQANPSQLAADRAQLVIAAEFKGQPMAVVPSLVGLTLAEAQKTLEATGLVLGRVTAEQLTVVVPPLVGMTLAEAQKTLELSGLKLGQVTSEQLGVAVPSLVGLTVVEAQKTLGEMGLVLGRVTSEQLNVTAPSLVGLTLAEAQKTLEASGLRLGQVTKDEAPAEKEAQKATDEA